MLTIGSRIRTKRIELGLSVDGLAEKLGKNRATIYRYENNDIENFPISVINPLAAALNTSPAYLMGWDDSNAIWTIKFKALLKDEIDRSDSADLCDACINVNRINDVIAGEMPLTFETACEIADEMGISLDEFLGRETQEKRTPESEDALDAEVFELLDSLTTEQLKEAVNFLRYLKSKEQVENPGT